MKLKHIFWTMIVFILIALFNNAYSLEAETKLEFNKFMEWGKKSGHMIKPYSYFCPYEKYTRNIANYIQTNGTISKGSIIKSKCNFVKISAFAKVIGISKDKKIIQILTHDDIYSRTHKVTIKKAFIESRYLQTMEEFKKGRY